MTHEHDAPGRPAPAAGGPEDAADPRPRLARVQPLPSREPSGAPAVEIAARLHASVEEVVRGKRAEITLVLAALACEGHVLFEDVPGTAKTVLARAIASSIEGATPSRIQCTPDLQPADVTGSSIFDQKARDFEFRPGPIFANIVLVDEINRATQKTQSALLEAMAERQVTVDGVTRSLASPFLLLATENPIEQEGTFLLPEAQLDRFLLRTSLGYPGEQDERQIVLDQRHGHPLEGVRPVVSIAEVRALQRAVEDVYVDPLLQRWIVGLVRATRDLDVVQLGASVRGSLALERSARAWALLDGREYVVPEDVEMLFGPVLGHRILFTPSFLAATRRMERDAVAGAGLRSLRRARAAPRRRLSDGRGRASHLPAPAAPPRRRPLVRSHAVAHPRRRSRSRGRSSVPARRRRPADRLARLGAALLRSRQRRVRRAPAPRRGGDAGCRRRRPQPLDGALPAGAAVALEAPRRRRGLCDDRRERDPRRVPRTGALMPYEAGEGATLGAALAELSERERSLDAGTFVFLFSTSCELPPDAVWESAAARGWDLVPVIVQDPLWEQSFPEVAGAAAAARRPRNRPPQTREPLPVRR